MLLIIPHLDIASSLSLSNRSFHGGRNLIRVHDNLAFRVSGGTAYCLNQGTVGTQEALFVRIQNHHQRHLRDVQALSQQVNTDQNIKLT